MARKAQLILVGGRPIPNVLTIIHERPEVIVAICSKESIKQEWPELKQAIQRLSHTSDIQEAEVDAFDVDAVQKACELEFLRCPRAEWIFNVTTATSLMTLGAYKAAESCAKYPDASVRCWYLDTANARVIPLVGKGRDNSIFSITVDQYVAAYNYGLQDASNIKDYQQRYLKEDWKAFARRLGKNPQEANLLKQVLIGSSRTAKRVVKSMEIHKFLQDLEAIGLVNKLREDGNDLRFMLSEEQYKFLDGAWLELYVYQESKDSELFDNVQWSKEIIDNDPDRTAKFPLQYKEMDVSLTYKARLIIVECKTGKKGLESEPLDDIVTIADLIGRGFVVKILVTSQGLPAQMDANQRASHQDFLTKAKRKGVFVVTQERLPQVGSILAEQAKISPGR